MIALLSKLDRLSQRGPGLVDELIVWSELNSGSDNLDGLNRMAKLADHKLSSLGFDVHRKPTAPIPVIDSAGREGQIQRGDIIHGRLRPSAKRRIMLAGHLDTVFPVDCDFQTCRKGEDGNLYGPGVADMKGGLLVMLEALACFEASELNEDIGFDVVINSDEEVGSYASSPYMESIAKDCDVGFVFEPAMTDGGFAGARAGSGNYVVSVTGRAAHAGREFDKGRNAIAGAARVVGALDALNGQREGVTLNVGLVQGGQALNVVPETATVRFNVRARKTEDLDWIDALIRETLEKGNFGPDISVRLHGKIHRPAKPMTTGLKNLFETVRSAGQMLDLPVVWKPTGGCCDGNNMARAGLPTVDTMGVRGAFIHSDREYMVMESLEERARLTALCLMMLASGEASWPKEVVL